MATMKDRFVMSDHMKPIDDACLKGLKHRVLYWQEKQTGIHTLEILWVVFQTNAIY